MAAQNQDQQLDDSSGRRRERKRPLWIRWIIVGIVLVLIAVGSIIWLLSGQSPWTSILPVVIFTVLGVMIGLFQWLFPVSSGTHEHSTLPFPTPLTSQASAAGSPLASMPPSSGHDLTTQPLSPASFTTNKTVYRGIVGLPPPTDPRTIQQREKDVKEVYSMLTQSDITAVVLTGIGGVGKSTLAALVYRYAEEQRHAGYGIFNDEVIWLTVNDSVTMADLVGTLFEILGKPMPDLSSLTPHNQAVLLFNALNTADQPRLVILDQFENLLDWQTGYALTDRPGVGEWLDAINSQRCTCRVLLTSRPWPQGTREYPPTHMQEYPVKGLGETEGIDLLRKHGIEATENELRTAVERCEGHAFALMLLVSLLRNHNLRLAMLFKDPMYAQLWIGDIARNFLDYIYTQQLDQVQRKLLLAFSVYREAVSLEAVLAITDFTAEVPRARILSALKTLRAQHLLQTSGGGRYQLHIIIADYAQNHFIQDDEQVNLQAMRAAHAGAAEYYLQLATKTCPPPGQRRRSSDVHDLIEAIWQLCQAQQWQEAYNLMRKEHIFSELTRWGDNAILLGLYQLLLDKWHAEPLQEAYIYNRLGEVHRLLGQLEMARSSYEQALKICREAGDREEQGWALNHLGRVYNTMGNKRQAQQYYEEALKIQREVGDRGGESRTLNNLGWIYYDLWQKELGREYYEEALKIQREVGDRTGEGSSIDSLGRLYHSLGQKERAQEYYEQALNIRREIGDRWGEGWTLYNLGRLYADLEEKERAREYYEEALRIHREVGDRRGEGWTINYLGRLYADLEGKERAQEYYEEALRIHREVGDRGGEGSTINNLAGIYNALGKKKQALKYYIQALNIRKEIGDRGGEGNTLSDIGAFYSEQSSYDIALGSFLLARDIFKEVRSTRLNRTQRGINDLQEKVGQEQFVALLARVEPRASQIVEQTLREGLVAKEQNQ